MQDQHTGQAGTFYIDPKTGQRLTQQQWAQLQQQKPVKKSEKTGDK